MTPSVRRALVTGGSGGIGAAICRRLAQAGHHVYVHAHRARAAARGAGARAHGSGRAAPRRCCFDVTDADGRARARSSALLAAGPIQILVNNAGIHDDAVFPGMTALQWQRVIDVSLHGFFNVTQPLLLPMMRTRWGRIINVSSVAALTGNRGQVNYAAAKGALNPATRALALEVASARHHGQRRRARHHRHRHERGCSFDDAAIARLVPMQRAGTGEEVASLIGFLAGDGAGYITGQVISINGGMC